MAIALPSDQLTPYFPRAPYNFENYPNGLPRHLRLLLDVCGQAILDYRTNLYVALGQVNITQALNAALDAHGILAGVPRISGEQDDTYRARILAALFAGKITLPAIQQAVQAYFVSTAANNANIVPKVTTYDIQSNPSQCAIDLYPDPATAQLVHPGLNDFVVQIIWPLPSQAWYQNFGYLGSTTYLVDTLGVTYTETDENLIRLVNSVRAAGCHPVYKSGYASNV